MPLERAGPPAAMEASIAQRLLDLNGRFYEEFATSFGASRGPEQPGLQRALDYLPGAGRLLDVGCGNGRLALALEASGQALDYLGIDSSAALLAIARRATAVLKLVRPGFLQVDVTAQGWTALLPAGRFQAIAMLALLHHLPAWRLRCSVLAALGNLLDAEGVLVVSTWQFLGDTRLQRKIVPWASIGLSEEQLEPGDVLLDWQRDGSGLRYCHMVDEVELAALAQAAGLVLASVYYADGRSQRLNLFGVLRRAC